MHTAYGRQASARHTAAAGAQAQREHAPAPPRVWRRQRREAGGRGVAAAGSSAREEHVRVHLRQQAAHLTDSKEGFGVRSGKGVQCSAVRALRRAPGGRTAHARARTRPPAARAWPPRRASPCGSAPAGRHTAAVRLPLLLSTVSRTPPLLRCAAQASQGMPRRRRAAQLPARTRRTETPGCPTAPGGPGTLQQQAAAAAATLGPPPLPAAPRRSACFTARRRSVWRAAARSARAHGGHARRAPSARCAQMQGAGDDARDPEWRLHAMAAVCASRSVSAAQRCR
jgi:hypothetical protein